MSNWSARYIPAIDHIDLHISLRHSYRIASEFSTVAREMLETRRNCVPERTASLATLASNNQMILAVLPRKWQALAHIKVSTEQWFVPGYGCKSLIDRSATRLLVVRDTDLASVLPKSCRITHRLLPTSWLFSSNISETPMHLTEALAGVTCANSASTSCLQLECMWVFVFGTLRHHEGGLVAQ